MSDKSALPPANNRIYYESECCESEHVAAYLDGELNSTALRSFEDHLKGCAVCIAALREHKELLRVLDHAQTDSSFTMALPKNFAQLVTARAQSDMSGVRARREQGSALWLCAPLILLCVGLLGISGCASVLVFAAALARHAASAGMFIARSLYDVGAGVSVILRAAGRNLINEPRPINLLALFLLAVALGLLPRLIFNYRQRALGITE